MISFSQAKQDLRLIGVKMVHTGNGGEIAVRLSGDGRCYTYYTDDVEDAWLTGKRLAVKHRTLN